MTSYNCSFICEPPLGGDQHLFLRSNLWYGDNNPLQWSQLFMLGYPHTACTPHSMALVTDPVSGGLLSIMVLLTIMICCLALESLTTPNLPGSNAYVYPSLTVAINHWVQTGQQVTSKWNFHPYSSSHIH